MGRLEPPRRGWWAGLNCRLCGKPVKGKTDGRYCTVLRNRQIADRWAEHASCRFTA